MSNQKSLLIPGDFPPVVSGIATYFREIWRFYPPESHIILAPQPDGFEEFDDQSDFNMVRKNISEANTTKAKVMKGIVGTFWTIVLHLRHKFSVIHCGQVLSSGITGWFMKKIFRVPYVVYVYGSETFRFGSSRLLSRLILKFLRKADLIVPNSQFTRDEFLALGLDAGKFHIITPGVDVDKFKPAPKREDLIQKYNLQDKQVLLTVARLDERKGHDKVIESLPLLEPNVVYLIVGKGREEARLRQLAQNFDVAERVIFCGYVPDEELADYYNLCDIFILLNRQTSDDPRLSGDYEGFGIVFLEASACAKPVIAGKYGGIADAIDNGKSGFIIDSTNTVDIQETINLILNDSDKAKELGNYGRRMCESSFTWRLKSEQLCAILKTI